MALQSHLNMSKQRQNNLNPQAKNYQQTLPSLKGFIEVPRQLSKVATQMKQNNGQRDKKAQIVKGLTSLEAKFSYLVPDKHHGVTNKT